MSPVSVALPPPDFDFQTEYIFSAPGRTQGAGGSQDTTAGQRVIARPGWVVNTEPGDNTNPIISSGAVTKRWELVGGRPGAALSPGAGNNEAYYMPLPAWQPAVGDGTGQAQGTTLPPSWVVAIIDVHMAMSQAAVVGAPTADRTGVFFIADGGALVWGPPGGGVSAPAGGFGVAVNDDGGGSYQYEYVSYDTVPNILQRTALVVPDVTLWSTFRFIIRSAVPGSPGTLSLEVNGTPVPAVTALQFDDVTLFQPESLNAQAGTFAFLYCAHDLPAASMFTQLWGRFGRFTPDGQERQGIA